MHLKFNFQPFFGILKEKKKFFGSCVVYTETSIHLSGGERD